MRYTVRFLPTDTVLVFISSFFSFHHRPTCWDHDLQMICVLHQIPDQIMLYSPRPQVRRQTPISVTIHTHSLSPSLARLGAEAINLSFRTYKTTTTNNCKLRTEKVRNQNAVITKRPLVHCSAVPAVPVIPSRGKFKQRKKKPCAGHRPVPCMLKRRYS